MKKFLPFLAVALFLTLVNTAFAGTYPIPPLPDWGGCSWDNGSSITYNGKYQQGEVDITFDLRLAIIGTEQDASGILYWIEIDLFNISELPAELQSELIANFGETASSVRVQILIPEYELTTLFSDPSQVYMDFSEIGYIRGCVYQYNEQTPYNVEPSLLGGFILPLFASEVMGEELPEEFLTDRDLGIRLVEDPDLYTTETSTSTTTTTAGTFSGYLYTYLSTEYESDTGTAFFTTSNPILPFVQYMSNWADESGTGLLELELTGLAQSGAATMITGTPIPFNLQTLMNYGM